MLNKPKYMIPSTKRQECVIDATANDIIFSCVVDGDEAIGAWEIKIYTLIDNALMFDSGKQKLSSPIFPINAKNENAEFEVNIKNFYRHPRNTLKPERRMMILKRIIQESLTVTGVIVILSIQEVSRRAAALSYII